jgi:hypothetical protein
MYIQLSARSSIQSRGGGAAFLGAAFTSVVFGASFFGSVFAGSAGFGASATLVSAFGGSGAFTGSTGFGASATFVSAFGGTGSTFAGSGFGGAAAVFVSGAFVGAPALRSIRRCMSRICFSRSATRDCDSFSALSLAMTSSWSALTRAWLSPPPLLAAPPALPPLSDFESLRTSEPPDDGGGGGVTAAVEILPLAADELSARGGSVETLPATFSRYDFQSATCVRISLFASFCSTAAASSAVGTLRIWPAFRRFMLLPENACWFCRYSDTSICSMLTVEGFTCSAILRSVSPFCTGPYVSEPVCVPSPPELFGISVLAEGEPDGAADEVVGSEDVAAGVAAGGVDSTRAVVVGGGDAATAGGLAFPWA